MMCQGCTEGQHYLCGMQTWCECDCPGPDGNYFDEIDPDAGLEVVDEYAYDPNGLGEPGDYPGDDITREDEFGDLV